MAIQIFCLNVIVVVFPVFRSGVVGRVDVDGVDLAPVCLGQGFQRMVVFAIDDRVVGLIPTAFDFSRA